MLCYSFPPTPFHVEAISEQRFLSSTEAGGTSYQQQLISDSPRDGFKAMFIVLAKAFGIAFSLFYGVLVDVFWNHSTDSRSWSPAQFAETFSKIRGIRSQNSPQNISKHAPQSGSEESKQSNTLQYQHQSVELGEVPVTINVAAFIAPPVRKLNIHKLSGLSL